MEVFFLCIYRNHLKLTHLTLRLVNKWRHTDLRTDSQRVIATVRTSDISKHRWFKDKE